MFCFGFWDGIVVCRLWSRCSICRLLLRSLMDFFRIIISPVFRDKRLIGHLFGQSNTLRCINLHRNLPHWFG